jgi:hypothetical protein
MLTARGGPIQRRGLSLPVHPLLVAAYPVIFLFATNAQEQVTLAPLWLPLAVAVGGAAVVLLVQYAVVRDWHLAALSTTVLVIGFFGYGHVWNSVGAHLPSQWPLIAVWLLIVVLALYAVWRLRRWAPGATAGLNAAAAILLLLNAWGMTQAVVAVGATTPVEAEASEFALAPANPRDLPDVYYLVPDRYAGVTALSEVYGWDNEPFLRALEDRGFAVARTAHANYIKTALSVASTLAADHLDAGALAAEQESGRDTEPIHRRLRQRLAVPAALKELGYQYIQVSSWWGPTSTNDDADRVFRYEGQDEFSAVLGQTTLLRAVTEPEAAPDDPWDWRVLREHALYELDVLKQVPEIPGPKFVFGHLPIPHPPYVLDVDGSFMDRPQVQAQGERESYIRQLQFTNDQLLEVIDRIIASDPDAVILLQSDEGPFPLEYARDEWGFRWRDATDEQLEEKFGILSAFRVPGADLEAAGWHDSITPVNSWRVIFNARFGTDLRMLPDRSWAHESLYRFFEFFEITDRLER